MSQRGVIVRVDSEDSLTEQQHLTTPDIVVGGGGSSGGGASGGRANTPKSPMFLRPFNFDAFRGESKMLQAHAMP